MVTIAKINGVNPENISKINFTDYEISKPTKLSGSIRDLLKNKVHFRNLLIAIVLWVSNLLSYYTVYFHIRYLGGDYFFNILAFGGCEVAAYAIGAVITAKIGFKASYCTSHIITIVAALLYMALKDNYTDLLPLVMALAGFGIVWGCNVNWNGNALLFPVIYASSTNGICNLFGRFASALAP